VNVKQNINIVNALIRITLGLTVVAWSTAKIVKRPRCDSYLILTMLGAMKVAEGILRFCPLTLLYEKYSQDESKQSHADCCNSSRDSMEGIFEEQMI
jgi:hypothetical protein